MKNQSYILKTNGEKIPVEPANGTDFSLEEMQKAVGGYIEVVAIDNKTVMVVNEEGKLKHLPVNPKATALYSNLADIIVGDALVCHRKQIK